MSQNPNTNKPSFRRAVLRLMNAAVIFHSGLEIPPTTHTLVSEDGYTSELKGGKIRLFNRARNINDVVKCELERDDLPIGIRQEDDEVPDAMTKLHVTDYGDSSVWPTKEAAAAFARHARTTAVFQEALTRQEKITTTLEKQAKILNHLHGELDN